MYIIGFLNILFPRLFLPVIFLFYLYKKKTYKYSLVYSFAFLAFSYRRLDSTGDITNYKNSFNSFYLNHSDQAFKFIEGRLYYIWNLINILVVKLNLKFEYVTLISMVLFFYSIFSIFDLIDFENNNKIRKKIIIKFFLVILIFIIFSSYKNIISFTLISYGIYKNIFHKKRGNIFEIIGLGFHISGIVLILLERVSKKIEIKKKHMILSIFLGLISKKIIKLICIYLGQISPYLSEKITHYTLGEWGQYNITGRSEIATYYLMVTVLLAVLYSIIDIDTITDLRLKKYNNFIKLYICFIFFIISYRTLAIRYIISAFPIFLLLFYENFIFLKKQWLKFFWFLMLDLRILMIPFNTSYQIGEGFIKEFINNIFKILNIF